MEYLGSDVRFAFAARASNPPRTSAANLKPYHIAAHSLRNFKFKSRTSEPPQLVDDVVPPVDIERFAGDEAGGIVRQEGGGDADVVDADQAAGRRLRLCLVE